ncbi:MAG: hypothetical protein WAN64_20865, partial [Pseudolabrys sp.]
ERDCHRAAPDPPHSTAPSQASEGVPVTAECPLCANSGHCVELFKDRVSFHRFNALANPSAFL